MKQLDTRISPAAGMLIAICAIFSMGSAAARADDGDAKGKVIAGWLEQVTIQASGGVAKAKLDTGAKTSSIHATKIKVFKRNGKKWVRFDLIAGNDPAKTVRVERERVRRVRIKDHENPSDRRSVVELELCFDGVVRRGEFTLVDRGNFLYPVLLGRRFLAGLAVVDAERTYLTRSTCAAEN